MLWGRVSAAGPRRLMKGGVNLNAAQYRQIRGKSVAVCKRTVGGNFPAKQRQQSQSLTGMYGIQNNNDTVQFRTNLNPIKHL